MTQTKEEAQEKARRKKDSAEYWEEYSLKYHGRTEADGKYIRCEWDTPSVYDERNPPGRAWSRYNYRLGRMEWSFAPIPAEHAADYEPQRVAVSVAVTLAEITPENIRRTAPMYSPPVTTAPRRRFVLPPIDKVRAG